MKKLVRILCVTIILALAIGQTAFAADLSKNTQPPKPTIGVESTDPNNGFGGSSHAGSKSGMRAMSTYLLSSWYCSIGNTGSALSLTGSSTCVQIVADIRLTIYLQRWNGSAWEDVNSAFFSDIYTGAIDRGTLFSYQSGNYYRTKCEHFAYDFGIYDIQYSYSSYIYVP